MSEPETRVFLHLQKTGGLTVDTLLREAFPVEAFAARGRGGHFDIPAALAARKTFFSGHITAAEIGQLPGKIRVFTLLRDPTARLISHINFLKCHSREKLETFNSDLLLRMKGNTLRETLADPDVEFWFRDYYVKFLDPEAQPGAASLERALEFLEKCEVVGSTERMDVFVPALFRALGQRPPAAIPMVNRLVDKKGRPGWEIEEALEPSVEELEVIKDWTRNDQVLYDWAARRQG